jgi:RNA polymerase sigma-70 factor, ECF subfamily
MSIAHGGADDAAPDRLLALARAGKGEAFCRLIEPLEGRLLRQAMALCGDAGLAGDLVQQTLVAAWQSLARYDGGCRLSTWLYAILVHRHYKALRAAARRPLSGDRIKGWEAERGAERLATFPGRELSPDEWMVLRERHGEIRSTVAMLPEAQRQVVLLRFFEDASLAEIAALQGCSLGTVKSRLHYALDRLRRLNLSGMGGDSGV